MCQVIHSSVGCVLSLSIQIPSLPLTPHNLTLRPMSAPCLVLRVQSVVSYHPIHLQDLQPQH